MEGSANPTPATPTKRKADNDHNNDTGVEHRRSPPHDRNIDKPIFKDDLDPSPPDYDTEATCEAIIASSYDDLIPRSLRGTRGGIDSAAILLDQEVSDHGQEMKERSGEGLLRRQRIEDNSKYSLGTYTPKIIMDDDRGDEDSGDSRQF